MGIQVFYTMNGNSILIQKLKLASQYQKGKSWISFQAKMHRNNMIYTIKNLKD